MEITVRHAEPEDYRALHRIFSGRRAIAGTLQMPFPQVESWRERLAEPPEGYSLQRFAIELGRCASHQLSAEGQFLCNSL
jgi:hypothetical protein